jgi:hypothetical protein
VSADERGAGRASDFVSEEAVVTMSTEEAVMAIVEALHRDRRRFSPRWLTGLIVIDEEAVTLIGA